RRGNTAPRPPNRPVPGGKSRPAYPAGPGGGGGPLPQARSSTGRRASATGPPHRSAPGRTTQGSRAPSPTGPPPPPTAGSGAGDPLPLLPQRAAHRRPELRVRQAGVPERGAALELPRPVLRVGRVHPQGAAPAGAPRRCGDARGLAVGEEGRARARARAGARREGAAGGDGDGERAPELRGKGALAEEPAGGAHAAAIAAAAAAAPATDRVLRHLHLRSEEHTSEL